jgi:two-component system chemotaxis response regulator CheB
MSLRVFVVDDSVLFRRVISDALSSIPGVEVIGNAANGKLALQRIGTLKPDLLTLDIEMPEMDGLAVLDALSSMGVEMSVLVVSALTQRGGQLTMKALEKGAFDFITKPEGASPEESRDLIVKELAPRLRAVMHRAEIRSLLRTTAGRQTPAAPASVSPQPEIIAQRSGLLPLTWRPAMILVGVSTGGPNALTQVLPSIPGDLGVPLFIVQHMPPLFTQSLADSLAAKCEIGVKEAAPQELAEPGIAYIAPGGKQMRIRPAPEGRIEIEITNDPPENNCRPSVDYLFRSASNHFAGRAMAVILTGMGSDGTLGLRLLKRNGCFVVAQNEASCVVYGMPKAAVDAGVVDVISPLGAVAAEIVRATRGTSGT